MKQLLNRRTLLKASGVSLALPFLESMNPAFAATDYPPPKRVVFVCTTLGLHAPALWPAAPGADYASTEIVDASTAGEGFVLRAGGGRWPIGRRQRG